MDKEHKDMIEQFRAYGRANNCSNYIEMFVIPEIIKSALIPQTSKLIYNIGA